MKNAIVVCVTPNWLAPAAVTLLSCAQHKAEKIADLLIVSFSLDETHQANLAVFNKRHSISIKLLNIDITDLQHCTSGPLGVGTLLRLKLDMFVSPHYNRVLYLDSDIVCESECATLFDTDLNAHAFAAVESSAMTYMINPQSKNHKKLLGLEDSMPYFNAGVLLFDWQKIRESNFLASSLKLLQSNPRWPFHDQDVLNSVAQGRWKMLDHKWNVTKKTADYLNLLPGFRHFNGQAKPWNTKSRFGFAKYHRYYHESLSHTPWQSFMEQPQRSWPMKDNLRALWRKVSFRRIERLKQHISLVADKI